MLTVILFPESDDILQEVLSYNYVDSHFVKMVEHAEI